MNGTETEFGHALVLVGLGMLDDRMVTWDALCGAWLAAIRGEFMRHGFMELEYKRRAAMALLDRCCTFPIEGIILFKNQCPYHPQHDPVVLTAPFRLL